jgi:hypothetical protein
MLITAREREATYRGPQEGVKVSSVYTRIGGATPESSREARNRVTIGVVTSTELHKVVHRVGSPVELRGRRRLIGLGRQRTQDDHKKDQRRSVRNPAKHVEAPANLRHL